MKLAPKKTKTTIWKFPIRKPGELVELNMPKDAEILGCQVQIDQPCIWARIDPETKLDDYKPRYFRIVGTGHIIRPEEDLIYIDTIQIHGGKLVFHIFEKLG